MSPHVFAPPRLASRGRRRRTLISLTPLIDVVFILLIFFMLASSFLDWRSIDMNVPVRAATGASDGQAMLVDVGIDGIRLRGAAVALADLANYIVDRTPDNAEARVLLRPATGVSLQQTIQVLDHLTASGIRNVSMIRATES